MNAILRAEWLKQCTTRTMLGVLAAMLGTVSLAAVIHVLGFGVALVDQRAEQLGIMLDIGVGLGLIFAAVNGAISITSEFRYGTIRSNLVKRPKRTHTLLAKVTTQLVVGTVLAAVAASTALGLAAIFLRIRNVDLQLTNSDVLRLILGGAFGGAMFAVIGLAVGTLVRNQVPVVVGTLVWTLFIETLLRGGVPDLGKFVPGSLARTVAGQTTAAMSSPAVAGTILVAVVGVALLAAHALFTRRDVG